jgi:hypothetical protein
VRENDERVSPQRIGEADILLTSSARFPQSGCMVRSAIVLACVVLVAACGKDVEDPGFTATVGGTMTSGASTGSSGGGDETTGTSDASATGNSNSNSNSTTEAADSSSEGGGTSGAADTGPAGCGDGMISPGEQCDGSDLQGFDCNSLGLNGGTLSCDPVTCTFDTSMCMSTSGGTSG